MSPAPGEPSSFLPNWGARRDGRLATLRELWTARVRAGVLLVHQVRPRGPVLLEGVPLHGAERVAEGSEAKASAQPRGSTRPPGSAGGVPRGTTSGAA